MTCGYTVISTTNLKGMQLEGMLASLPLAAQDCFARSFLDESRLKGSAMDRHIGERFEMALVLAKYAEDI